MEGFPGRFFRGGYVDDGTRWAVSYKWPKVINGPGTMDPKKNDALEEICSGFLVSFIACSLVC